jgi:hypothetical protein
MLFCQRGGCIVILRKSWWSWWKAWLSFVFCCCLLISFAVFCLLLINKIEETRVTVTIILSRRVEHVFTAKTSLSCGRASACVPAVFNVRETGTYIHTKYEMSFLLRFTYDWQTSSCSVTWFSYCSCIRATVDCWSLDYRCKEYSSSLSWLFIAAPMRASCLSSLNEGLIVIMSSIFFISSWCTDVDTWSVERFQPFIRDATTSRGANDKDGNSQFLSTLSVVTFKCRMRYQRGNHIIHNILWQTRRQRRNLHLPTVATSGTACRCRVRQDFVENAVQSIGV